MVPASLQHLLDISIDAVRAHPQHALVPIRRWQLYAYLGSVSNETGRRRRARLALLSAYHVIPIWREERPEDDRAERLLILAENVLQNTVDVKAAGEEAEKEWHWLIDDDGGRYEKLSSAVYFAFGAVVQAEFAALEGDSWDNYRFTEDETDADVDIWSSDTAKWAVNAIAGPVWEPNSDNTKRLEFWTWWLTEAIPAAWQEAQ